MNNHTSEGHTFSIEDEMLMWERRELGRKLRPAERKRLWAAIEANMVYSEFFDTVEENLLAAL